MGRNASVFPSVKDRADRKIRELTGKIRTIRDVAEHPIVLSSEYVRRCMTERIDLADGCVRVLLDVEERYYYEMLSEYAGKN